YDFELDNQKSWFATDRVGGSILVDGGTFSIRRSIISNHGQLGGSSSYGAGIGVTGGNVTVEETSFSLNDGDISRATDLFNDGGTVSVTNCTFASSDPKIGSVAGALTLSQSGSPSFTFGTGLSFVDTDAPTYTPNPNIPIYTGDCASQITNLPVELTSFEGKCINNGTELTWQTASEYNNAYFVLERAGIDSHFEVIEKLPGSLNSSDLLTYYYSDEHPKLGINYYRLSQVDVDGRSESFEPITVYNNCTADDLVVTYLAKENSLYFSMQLEEVLSIALLNMAGQVVEYLEIDPRDSISKLQLKNPPGMGVYILKIDRGGMIETGKVLISN
ncbi:MAG: T9SS type A sorting domain-containing protein, partial [Crocinitomicaceae bacterium]